MRRADHMKPPRAAPDTEPRLVQMFHSRARRRKPLYMPGCHTQTACRVTAHRPQRRRRHTRLEQNLQNLTQAALRKKLRMTQPDRQRRKTRTILNRTPYPLRKRPLRHSPATSATTGMTAMLRYLQRTRSRKVEYLAQNRRPLASRSRKRSPATPAYLRNMVLNKVRDRHTAKRMTLVTRLPPGFRPVRPRRLRVRRSARGFFNPSLDGGWPLFPLFRPRRRSNATTRSSRRAFRSRSHAFSNSRRANFSPEGSDPDKRNGSNGSGRLIQRLPHFSIQPSTPPGQLRHPMTCRHVPAATPPLPGCGRALVRFGPRPAAFDGHIDG